MRDIPLKKELTLALELCGFPLGDKQESRLMNILGIILRLEQNPPIPLAFSDIYEQIQKEEPGTKLTKAWVHRVLKQLIESKLVRIDSPTAHRKRYIADVNTLMAGFEQLKSKRMEELEQQQENISRKIAEVTAIDCGHISREFVKGVTGRQEVVSSRIVRGVEELHRVLRFNMIEKANDGDIIRASMLWTGPFLNESTEVRIKRFFEAAERGADIRYLISTDIFQMMEDTEVRKNLDSFTAIARALAELRARGKLFDTRLYGGPKTYNQVSLNTESMALVIAEDPVTATWITREFNPDLIDNAVQTFDREWKKAKSLLTLTPEDFDMFGVGNEGIIRKVFHPKE